jgi:hypothetical protein
MAKVKDTSIAKHSNAESTEAAKKSEEVAKEAQVAKEARAAKLHAEALVEQKKQAEGKQKHASEPKTLAVDASTLYKSSSSSSFKPAPLPSPPLNTKEKVSDDVIQATAKQLREDLHVDKWMIDLRGGDAAKAERTLSSLPRDKETMKRLNQAYAGDKEHPGSLVTDIDSSLSKNDGARLKATVEAPESAMIRLEGATQRLTEAAKRDADFKPIKQVTDFFIIPNPVSLLAKQNAVGIEKDLVAGRRELREQLSVMSSKDVIEASKESLLKHGQPLEEMLLSTPGLREEDKEAIRILLKGSDVRAKEPGFNLTLAQLALQAKDIDMLREGLGNSPEARKLFNNETYIDYDPAVKFLSKSFTGKDLQIAQDLAKHGETQVATLIDFNQGLFGTDKDGVVQAVKNMGSEQRERLRRGHDLASVDKGSVNQSPGHSAQELESIEAYAKFNQALKSSFNPREASALEAQVLYGDNNLISKLAQTHSDGFIGIGSGHDKNKIYDLVDRELTAEDFNRLKTQPNFRRDLNTSLKAFLSQEEIERGSTIVDRKLQADSFESSKAVGRTTLEKWQDLGAEAGAKEQGRAIVDVLEMNQSERAHYKNEPGYRSQLDRQLTETFGQDTDGGRIARRLLAETLEGKEAKLTPLERVKVGGLNGDNLAKSIDNIESYIKSEPSLLSSLKEPKTVQEKEVRSALENELSQAVNRSGEVYYDENGGSNFDTIYKPLAKSLFEENGRVEIGEKLRHTDRDIDAYKALSNLSEQEKAAILSNAAATEAEKNIQREVFARLNRPEERQLAQEIAAKGEFTALNQLRAAAITEQSLNAVEIAEVKASLGQVKYDERNALNNAYAKQYKDNLSDILGKLPEEERPEVAAMLTASKQNRAEQIERLAEERRKSESGLLGSVDFGDRYTATQSLDNFRKANETASAKFEDLPVEEQQRLFKAAQESLTSWQKQKEETTSTVTDGAIVVGSLAVAVGTAGATTPLLFGAVGAAGAATKVGGNKLLLGEGYDLGNYQRVAADGAGGFVNSAVALLGPQQLAAAFKIGDGAASATSKEFVSLLSENLLVKSKYLLKEGGEQALEKGLSSLYREAISQGKTQISEEAVKSLAVEVATEGSENLIERALVQAVRTSKPTKATVLLTELGLNAATGSLAGSGSELVSVIGAWNSDKSVGENLSEIGNRTIGGALSGAGAGVVFTAGLKVLGASFSKAKNNWHGSATSGLKETGEKIDLTFSPNAKDGSIDVSGLSRDDLYMVILKRGEPTEVITKDGSIKLSGDEKIAVVQKMVVKPEYAELSPLELKKNFADDGISNWSSYWNKALTQEYRLYHEVPLANGKTRVYVPLEESVDIRKIESNLKAVKAQTTPVSDSSPSLEQSTTVPSASSAMQMPELHYQRLTPSLLASDLRDLPDGGEHIRQMFIENRGSYADPWHTVDWFEQNGGRPFVSEAAANSDAGVLTFYPELSNTIENQRQPNIRHEWSHLHENQSAYRRVYDYAIDIENSHLFQPLLLRDYAGFTNRENWAVHIGEAYLADSDDVFRNKLVLPAKGTISAIKELIHAKALEEALESGVKNGHKAPRYEELMARSLWAQKELTPGAQEQLEKVITGSDSWEERNLALRIYPKLFGTEGGAKLLTMKPRDASDLGELFAAAGSAYKSGRTPDSILQYLAKKDGPHSADAFSYLYSRDEEKALEIARAKFEDGTLTKVFVETGHPIYADLITDMIAEIDTPAKQIEAINKILKSVSRNTESQDYLFDSLAGYGADKFDDQVYQHIIDWAAR